MLNFTNDSTHEKQQFCYKLYEDHSMISSCSAKKVYYISDLAFSEISNKEKIPSRADV